MIRPGMRDHQPKQDRQQRAQDGDTVPDLLPVDAAVPGGAAVHIMRVYSLNYHR